MTGAPGGAPGRHCTVCGREKTPKIEEVEGVYIYTFPKRCKFCHGKNKTSKTPWVFRPRRPSTPPPDRKTRRKERLKNAAGGPYESSRYIGRVILYGFMCAYCVNTPADNLDHAVPISRGGSNWPSNIYPSCARCNTEKGDKILYKEWTPPRLRNSVVTPNKSNT